MIIAKLVLFALPLLVASMLFLANPAAASPVDSAKTHFNSASAQPIHELVKLNQVDKSNPILDHLGCNCAYCIEAKSHLEGKLSISDIL